MKRWEYLILRIAKRDEDRAGKLDELGKIGWELVQIVDDVEFFFKRPLTNGERCDG